MVRKKQIEIQGVVSDFAAAGASHQQRALTRDDMMQMTQRLVGMPLTLDHWHPRTAAAAGHGSDVTEHISVGRITRSWIDDIGCLRITALIDADVSESIGGRIKAGDLSGFSLGLAHDAPRYADDGSASYGKELIECSITPNPEYKLTSFIAGVREVGADELSGGGADERMQIDQYVIGSGSGVAETAPEVSASSGERDAAVRGAAERALVAVRQARGGNSERATLTQLQTRGADASHSARASAMQHPQGAYDAERDDKTAPQPNMQQQHQQAPNTRAERALAAGSTFTQSQARSDVSPVVVHNHFQLPPQFDPRGGANRRAEQRNAYNAQHFAPQPQPMRQPQQQQQQQMLPPPPANDDDYDGDIGYDQEAPQQEMQYHNAPPPQPSKVGHEIKQPAARITEQQQAKLDEMRFERSTGKFSASSANEAEAFQQWLAFKAAQAAAQGASARVGQKRGAAAAQAPTQVDYNPSLSLNEDPTATPTPSTPAQFVITADDDDETVRAKMTLLRKQQKSAATTNASVFSGTPEPAAATPSARTRVNMASIKERLAATTPTELQAATAEVGEATRDVEALFDRRRELDKLLEKDERGQVKVASENIAKRDELLGTQAEIANLSDQIRGLLALDDDDPQKTAVAGLLEQKKALETKYIAEARKFAIDSADLVRRVSNANNQATPEFVKEKLLAISAKPTITKSDLRDIAERVQMVTQFVSASHESSASTLEEVRRLSALAQQNEIKKQFDAKESADLARYNKIGAAASSAVAGADPHAKAGRTQAAAAAMAAASSNNRGGTSGVGGVSGVSALSTPPAAPTKNPWSHLITPDVAAKLQTEAPIFGATENYPGYNARTLRQAKPIDQFTPNDLYGLPYNFVPDANTSARAQERGFAAGLHFQQKRRSAPAQLRGIGSHVLTGAHMTGDPRVLNIGIKDEMKPGERPLVTRDMFASGRQTFMPPSGAKQLDSGMLLLGDDKYARQ